MHTLTIGFGPQTAVHLQYQSYSEAKIVFDRLQAAHLKADLIAVKDDYHQELSLDPVEIQYVLLQDAKKSLEAMVEMSKLQSQAQRAAQAGGMGGAILPFAGGRQ